MNSLCCALGVGLLTLLAPVLRVTVGVYLPGVGAGPALPVLSYCLTPSAPYWSYAERFLASESVSFASWAIRNALIRYSGKY